MIDHQTLKTIQQYRLEEAKPKLLTELDLLIDKLTTFKQQIHKLDTKNPNISVHNNMILWFTPLFLVWDQTHSLIETLNTLNRTGNNE